MKRREYCALSKEVSQRLLNEVLSGDDQEIVLNRVHDYLRELAGKMREFTIPVQKYVIYTVGTPVPMLSYHILTCLETFQTTRGISQ